MLALLYAHPRDKFVRFDEGPHKYYISEDETFPEDSGDNVISVTGFLKGYYDEFDAPGMAARIVARLANDDNPPEKDKRYIGKTAEEIVALWENAGKEASGEGTKMHLAIELFYNGDLDEYPDTPEFKYFLDFNNDVVIRRGLKPFRTEMCVYDADRLICGQIDMLYVKKFENSVLYLALYDWKRAKEMVLEGFRGRKCKGICNTIPDSNYGHYSLQLNIYRWFILEHYRTGFKYDGKEVADVVIDEMTLVVLHPNHGKYLLYEVSVFERVNEMMDTLLHIAKRSKKE